jgi:hypothetical protein
VKAGGCKDHEAPCRNLVMNWIEWMEDQSPIDYCDDTLEEGQRFLCETMLTIGIDD